MRLIPWNYDREVEKLVNSAFNGQRRFADWLPAIDVQETKDALQVKADLPGLAKDDIQVTLENNVLSISGERKAEASSDEGGWQRYERSSGYFVRTISLPQGYDEQNVKADYKDGVLSVRVGKSDAAKTKVIKID